MRTVLPTSHQAGNVSRKGPGRAVARAHVSVSAMRAKSHPAQGVVGSSRVEPAQGHAGDRRNRFVGDREAAAAATNCRF